MAERIEAECRLDGELLELLWRRRLFFPAVLGAGPTRWSTPVSGLCARTFLLVVYQGSLTGRPDPPARRSS